MLAVPVLIPVASPVLELIVAFAVLLLLHAPPAGEDASVVVLPTQTADEPIAAGALVTVATIVDVHPVLVTR
jgi:hypothetical protein